MGCLYQLPGRIFVAQQSGWDGATSAHFFPDGVSPAPMVARWEGDCIRCQHARQTMARLYCVGRWWSPQRSDQRGARRTFSQLVAGWQFPDLRKYAIRIRGGGSDRDPSTQFEDRPTHDIERLCGVLGPEFIARRRLSRRVFQSRPSRAV